ncbi:hypothetical protein Tco_0916373, partial [Tanacetum coccineum]
MRGEYRRFQIQPSFGLLTRFLSTITKEELASLRAQIDELVGVEKVWIETPGCIAWDKVDNPSPQSTPQVLPSFK